MKISNAKAQSPIVGSAMHPRDLKRLTTDILSLNLMLSGDNNRRELKLLQQLWSTQVGMLESMIDGALYLPEVFDMDMEDNEEAEAELMIQFELVGEDEENLPTEIKHFLRSLERLVERTQAQLKRNGKKNDE